jgi:hypothetical protein
VLVGKDGLGPWQDREMRSCLNQFARRQLPVIPVLLPNALEAPELPIFLNELTWVDLRGGLTKEGIDQLQWGITGNRLVAMSRADLNEPQSSTSSLPNLSSAVVASVQSTQTANAYARPSMIWGPLVGLKHTRLAPSIAVLVLLTVAAALFSWLWWTTPQIGRDARQDEQQKQVVELVQAGYEALRSGDPMTAVRVFGQAETIAPEKQRPSLRNLRLEAEKKAQMIEQLGERQKRIQEHLTEAQQAIGNRRFEEALMAVNSALVLDPNNAQAQRLRNMAQAGQVRLYEQANLQHADRQAPTVTSEPPNSLTISERSVALVDLGYSIYVYDIVQEPDKEGIRSILPGLYMRLGLNMPDADLLNATRRMFADDYDSQCFEIGLGLGVATGVGLVIIAHKGTSFEEKGRQQMPDIAAKLREALSSVGIRELVEGSDAKITEELLPLPNETSDSYYKRMSELRARIKGAYRRNYGPR